MAGHTRQPKKDASGLALMEQTGSPPKGGEHTNDLLQKQGRENGMRGSAALTVYHDSYGGLLPWLTIEW